jgi:hypothetical protein
MKKVFKKRMYLGDFTGWGKLGKSDYGSPEYSTVTAQFNAGVIPEPAYVYAWYSYEDYSGSAIVIYKEGRKWFYVSGGHCSCHGLEGQWQPEEFKPADHFKAVKAGKRIITFYGGDEKQVDEWLAWAVKDIVKKKVAKKARLVLLDMKNIARLNAGEHNQ